MSFVKLLTQNHLKYHLIVVELTFCLFGPMSNSWVDISNS